MTFQPCTRLLLADDHTIVREGLKRILDPERNGWEIIEAGTGFQALECLARQPINLAIVDLTMPGMNGLDLIRHIKTRCALSRPAPTATSPKTAPPRNW